MKILITTPIVHVPHGGMRILFEWCIRLKNIGHEVGLFVESGNIKCDWYDLSSISVTNNKKAYKDYDCVVIGSPHSIWMQDYIKPHQKCFLFMQMVEEKFKPNDGLWHRLCKQFYLSRFPIIHGSKWGEAHCRSLGRTGEMHYIGNGVNLDHFPISTKPKDGKIILLEGCFSNNPAKDTDRIALWAGQLLRHDGYKIIAYGFDIPKGFGSVISEYNHRPSVGGLNDLYERATILLKATKYDARALSPMEAATKGTPTIRAIIEGDDDLTSEYNCLRVPYSLKPTNKLFWAAKRVLDDSALRDKLSNNARSYVQEHCNWDKIINKLNNILCS